MEQPEETEQKLVTVLFRPDLDELLEQLAPSYLGKGKRQTSRRVEWAITEFLKSRGVSTDEPQGGKRGK